MEILRKFFARILLFSLIFILVGKSYGNDKILEAFRRSYLLESEGSYNAALNQLKAIADPDSYEINLRMGWLAYMAGSQMESKGYYERSIQLKPFSIEPKIGITYPESAMGNWDAVINQYKAILAIAPSNSLILYNLGLIHYNQNRFNEAEILFKKLVNLFPFDYDGLLMLGWTNFQLKKYREAKVLFQKALLNTPSSESAQEGLRLIN
jgi:tetratricopeptide (TPR) repeat protein